MKSRNMSRTHVARLSAIATAAILVFGVAACGGSDAVATSVPTVAQGSPTPTATPRPLVQTATPLPTSGLVPALPTLIKASAHPEFGEILTDRDGRTLYMFDRDAPGTLGCTGGCLANWPPLLAIGAPLVDGVTGRMGTTDRGELGRQVTINDKPLYYYLGDKAPGDSAGQGAGGVWWVVSPDGFPLGVPVVDVTASPAVPSTPTAVPTTPPALPTPAGLTESFSISSYRLPGVIVTAGTTVKWTNRDTDAHSVIHGSDPSKPEGEFESQGLGLGESYSHVFDKAGTYDYFCGIHTDMRGKIIVNPPPAAPTATPTPTGPVPPTVTPTPTPTVPPTSGAALFTPTPGPKVEPFSIEGDKLPSIVVKVGALVEWTNLDGRSHTVTQGTRPNATGMFDSLNLGLGQKFKFAFVVPGTYDYFCKIHASMNASVLVNP